LLIKTKIYYLTRSYSPYQKGGGPLMRTGAVKYLQELDWDVTVVMPNYNSKEVIIENNIIQIPFEGKHIQKLASLLERVGVYEDYLDKWIENAFEHLKDKITKEDIIFATSGGELGMIKLGSLLKDAIHCKFVVNFRDPLNYGYMDGLRRDKKPHIGREKAHEKYITNSDLILTSSKYYAEVLKERFKDLKDKIHNNYFGYIKQIDTTQYMKIDSKKLRIAYAGIMSDTQKPELLYEAYKLIKNNDDIELYFIGNRTNYKPLHNIEDTNVYFIDFLPHDEFLKFMCENIDVGFVSLTNDYYGACVPSKIYEYINLELPMIGALPDGDGIGIISDRKYGYAVQYDDINNLCLAVEKFKNIEILDSIKKNVINDKYSWDMKITILEVDKLLRAI